MPRSLDRDERLAAVSQAAWRVLSRQGIEALSVRNVAAEAGLAPSSLRYVLPTQASVRVHAIELVVERFSERVNALDHSREDWARAALTELLPLDDERRLEVRVFVSLGAAALTSEDLSAAFERAFAATRKICAKALRSLGRPASHVEVARLHALLDGLAVHMLHQDVRADSRWALKVLDAHLRSG